MVKGRRGKAVLTYNFNDDCSPHPKKRGRKAVIDRPSLQLKNNTIAAFFPDVDLEEPNPDILNVKFAEMETEDKNNSLLTLVTKDTGLTVDTPVKKGQRAEAPPTPHRIELCSEETKNKDEKKRMRGRKGENRKVTDYFPVRRSVRKTEKTVMEEKQRSLQQMLRNGVEEGLEVKAFADKGRGVVTSRPFTKGDFVVEYSGDLIDLTEAKLREIKYAQDLNTGCYMYYFKHSNQQYCVDATAETGRLGRLVNHSRNGNLVTRSIWVDSKPRLMLIARDDIKQGEELTYDYGDRSKESLKHHPWLAY